MRYYTRTCALCTNKIRTHHKLCGDCFRLYKSDIDTLWLKEMIRFQQRQDVIDSVEGHILPFQSASTVHGAAEQPIVALKKSIGRPSTEWTIVADVLQLFDDSLDLERRGLGKRLSLRDIAKKLNNMLGYVTVRNILLEKRAEEFNKR